MSSRTAETTAQLQCIQKGGPFQIAYVPKPRIQSNQVLIRQRVVALNGLDWKQRDFGLFISRWPHVLGIEGAGVVEAVGSNVKHIKAGDEVTAWMAGQAHGNEWGGSYQEHVIMPAQYVAKKPKNITIEEAASLPICYVTAISAIYSLDLRIPITAIKPLSTSRREPKSILILGGSSSIGANAIQLLRLAYSSLPIFATSSASHHSHLLDLGATRLFDYRSRTLASDIKAASPEGHGVDMIIDCVSAGASDTTICECLDSAGSKKYAAVVSGIDVPVPDGVTKINVGGWSLIEMQGGEHVIPSITELIEEGKYKVPLPVKVVGHGLNEIQHVLDQVKTVTGTKLVVKL
ncbi:putative quinone oxidoreductase [Talaromyces proteolyticus]|uniref:Quinone oxidoreductase n=1 Tax=Talaromyces proteolyticus TaxID=1131652 RepID=A0AAD4KQ12_9EURO|nr:putative quinone oxidoreductase [Talaromyces proteolyticus]KAH8696744.1 putative quinone oxidoreductase [Talaromyces proteolyticus]